MERICTVVDNNQFKVIRLHGIHPCEHDIFYVRSSHHIDKSQEHFFDSVDEYSEIYILYLKVGHRESRPISTMRVTRFIMGNIECMDSYPVISRRFFEEFNDVAADVSRLVTIPNQINSVFFTSSLMLWAAKDQFALGARVVFFNVHNRMIKYYERKGFFLIHDSFFVHPRLRTPSHLMVFFPHPVHKEYGHISNDLVKLIEEDNGMLAFFKELDGYFQPEIVEKLGICRNLNCKCRSEHSINLL